MKPKNPMKGLLTFGFHAASGNVSVLLLGLLALSLAFLVTGVVFFLNIFLIYAVTLFPMSVVMSMGDKDGKWERFQLTLPVRRRHLLQMQYLVLLLAILVSAIFVVGIVGLGTILHEAVFEMEFVPAMVNQIPALSLPFLMMGVFFPLGSSKVGRGRESSILTMCMLGSIGILMFMPQIENWLGLSFHIIAAVFAGVSVLVFGISYFITRAMYVNMDF